MSKRDKMLIRWICIIGIAFALLSVAGIGYGIAALIGWPAWVVILLLIAGIVLLFIYLLEIFTGAKEDRKKW